MNLGRYRFRSAWSVPARSDALFDVLADLRSYPQWWPQVRRVEPIDDDTALVLCRSVLPYDLRLRAARACQDSERGALEVTLSGDLHGWSRWTLRPEGAATSLLYEQEVEVRNRALRLAGLVGRPLLRLNHHWMMLSGRRGLQRRLASGRAQAAG